jgi:hypothetical protein
MQTVIGHDLNVYRIGSGFYNDLTICSPKNIRNSSFSLNDVNQDHTLQVRIFAWAPHILQAMLRIRIRIDFGRLDPDQECGS